MIKAIISIVVISVAAIGFALYQTHTNSLAYQFRNCTEISDNSGYIGFQCPNGWSNYVPTSERAQVYNDLSPVDQTAGASGFNL